MKRIVLALMCTLVLMLSYVPIAEANPGGTFVISSPSATFHDASIRLYETEGYHTFVADRAVIEKLNISGDYLILADKCDARKVLVKANETELTGIVLGIRLKVRIVGGEIVEPAILPDWLITLTTGILPILDVENIRIAAESLTASSTTMEGMRIEQNE